MPRFHLKRVTGTTAGGELVARRIRALRVVSFGGGAAIALGDPNNKFTLVSTETFRDPDGWDEIWTFGQVTLDVSHDFGVPLEPVPVPPLGFGSASSNNAGSQLLATSGSWQQIRPNTPRRRFYSLQNLDTQPLWVSHVGGGTAPPSTDSGAIAVMSACAVLNDGSGGSWAESGWTGPIFLFTANASGSVPYAINEVLG